MSEEVTLKGDKEVQRLFEEALKAVDALANHLGAIDRMDLYADLGDVFGILETVATDEGLTTDEGSPIGMCTVEGDNA